MCASCDESCYACCRAFTCRGCGKWNCAVCAEEFSEEYVHFRARKMCVHCMKARGGAKSAPLRGWGAEEAAAERAYVEGGGGLDDDGGSDDGKDGDSDDSDYVPGEVD